MAAAIRKAENYLVHAQADEARCEEALNEARAKREQADGLLNEARAMFSAQARDVLGIKIG